MRTESLQAVDWTGWVAGVRVRRVSSPRAEDDGRPVVIFDGDDTLWQTEALYDEARRVAGEIVVSQGLSFDEWWTKQTDIDVRNVGRFGLLAERFPTSCVEAYELLAAKYSAPVEAQVSEAIWNAAYAVFLRRAPLNDHADAVLRTLSSSHRLVLLTQGDPRVQGRRIEDSGLSPLFDEILIVETKSAAVMGAVVDELKVDHRSAWMVGNSVPSDVNPALSAGLRAIWIDAHVWDHERREALLTIDGVFIATDLREVPSLIAEDEE